MSALAAKYAALGDLQSLASGVSAEYISPRIALAALLRFLPEATEPSEYVELVYRLNYNEPLQLEASTDVELSGEMEQLSSTAVELPQFDDLDDWIQQRIRQVDSYCGRVSWFKVFAAHPKASAALKHWYNGIVVVADRARHENAWISIVEFENLPSAVGWLLRNATAANIKQIVTKDVLPHLVAVPSHWYQMYDWIANCYDVVLLRRFLDIYFDGETSVVHSSVAVVEQFKSLSGPILVSCYRCPEPAAYLADLVAIANALLRMHGTPENYLQKLAGELHLPSSLSPNEYVVEARALLSPTDSSDSTVSLMKSAVEVVSVLPSLALFDVLFARKNYSDEQQQPFVRQVLAKNSANLDKTVLDLQVLQESGLVAKVDSKWISKEILHSALAYRQFDYAMKMSSSVPDEDFQQMTLQQFALLYDKASNGNITRGTMKEAAHCLRLLVGKTSDDIERARALLEATHELSNFSLTKVYNDGKVVAVTPKMLRLEDPLWTIQRVLELNDCCDQVVLLTGIASNLFYGTRFDEVHVSEPVDIRVRAMCIDAALASGNFDLAYDLCIPSLCFPNSLTAWTACFQVGKFMSALWDDAPPIRILHKKSYALELCLSICPRESISIVLKEWRRVEQLLLEEESYSQEREGEQLATSISNVSNGSGPRKRDQISNLLVSGLGWAIGATK